MERRNRALKALDELIYIDSLESYERADALVKWHDKYLTDMNVTEFDLEMKDFQRLLELFYKNINFLKEHTKRTKEDMITNRKMVRFLKN